MDVLGRVPCNHFNHYQKKNHTKYLIISEPGFRSKVSPLLLASTQNWAPWSNVSFVPFWKLSDKFFSICSLCRMLNFSHVNFWCQIPIPNVFYNCSRKKCLNQTKIMSDNRLTRVPTLRCSWCMSILISQPKVTMQCSFGQCFWWYIQNRLLTYTTNYLSTRDLAKGMPVVPYSSLTWSSQTVCRNPTHEIFSIS